MRVSLRFGEVNRVSTRFELVEMTPLVKMSVDRPLETKTSDGKLTSMG